MSGITARESYAKAREITLVMGEYFQVQDDVLDCFGLPEEIGTASTCTLRTCRSSSAFLSRENLSEPPAPFIPPSLPLFSPE